VPGEVKTEVFDTSEQCAGGKKDMQVRFYHKLASGADGVPGASRTLVISAPREHSTIRSARRIRFMRFCDTPDGDCDRDKAGAVVAPDARFASWRKA